MNKLQKILKLIRFKIAFFLSRIRRYDKFKLFEWDSIELLKMDIPNENLLAENMFLHEGKYYLVFSNYNNNHVGILETTDPKGLWELRAQIALNASAPHLFQHEGKWYLFYHDNKDSICLQVSDNLLYGYSPAIKVIMPVFNWEQSRVHEPFVIKVKDVWIMLYMGDSGNFTEQIGMARSPDLIHWYKSHRNPVLKFGKSYDKGTVADPWIYEEDGLYYVGYACGRTKHRPWRTALSITADFEHFLKLGVILNLGWRSNCAFRGALTKIGNTYYFPHTARIRGKYKIRLAIKKL